MWSSTMRRFFLMHISHPSIDFGIVIARPNGRMHISGTTTQETKISSTHTAFRIFKFATLWNKTVESRRPWTSVFRTSTCHSWFWKIKMRPNDLWDSFPYSSTNKPHSQLSLPLSVNEVACFYALGHQTLLQSFIIFYASKNLCVLLSEIFSCHFDFWCYCIFFITAMNTHFTFKMDSHARDAKVLLVPNNHDQDSTILAFFALTSISPPIRQQQH
jgi:hypothetical protein